MFRVKSKIQPVGFPPVSKTLPKAVKKIAETLEPEKIILFGSYAYGKPTPDSDVDLLIVMKSKGSYRENLHAVSMLLYPRPFPVDIIIKTPKEINEAMKGGKDNGFFIREIVNKGKVLYDRYQRT